MTDISHILSPAPAGEPQRPRNRLPLATLAADASALCHALDTFVGDRRSDPLAVRAQAMARRLRDRLRAAARAAGA